MILNTILIICTIVIVLFLSPMAAVATSNHQRHPPPSDNSQPSQAGPTTNTQPYTPPSDTASQQIDKSATPSPTCTENCGNSGAKITANPPPPVTQAAPPIIPLVCTPPKTLVNGICISPAIVKCTDMLSNGTCPASKAPNAPLVTKCPTGYTLQSDGSCLNTDPSVNGPPSNLHTCPNGKPAPENGICSYNADGTQNCFDGSVLAATEKCHIPESVCPAQPSGLGGGEVVTNLNTCPKECPSGLIKTADGCPTSFSSFPKRTGSTSSSSSSSSSSGSSRYSTKDTEMSILGYLEGCQGNTAVFNNTIENNQIFKTGYGSGSDCPDDMMNNVMQILNVSKTNTVTTSPLTQHEAFLQCYNSVQNPQVRHTLESIPNFLLKYEKMIMKNMTGDVPIPSITGNRTNDIQIMQASMLTDNEIIACMKGVPPMTNSTLVLSSSIVPASSHGGCQAYNCNPVPCKVAPSVMCYTAFNVNLNTTVQLANPLSYPNTTIDPSGCHIDIVTQTQNVLKEKQQNPAMYKSDSKALGPIDAPLLWCGIEK